MPTSLDPRSNIADLQQWVGRTQTEHDELTLRRVRTLAATLDDTGVFSSGVEVPLGWHWILFHPLTPTHGLGGDGHGPRGTFLPPVTLSRRMWAGGRLRVHIPLRADDLVQRDSEILSIAAKSGRSGQLVFVTVRHRLSTAAGLAIDEEQDIVYRDQQRGSVVPNVPAPKQPTWRREVHPNSILLFRYSALTFNGHRIHYDRKYATEVEGYAGLVVHGPLIATYLIQLALAEAGKARLTGFQYRGVAPLFDSAPFHVCGKPVPDSRHVDLWAETPDGALAMSAQATLS